MRIRYRDLRTYKYELRETYQVATGIHPIGPAIRTDYLDLDEQGLLTIRAGYAWDGPSGPAIDTPNFMRGSLVHDALYQLIRMGLLPKEKRGGIDRLLLRICLEDGMSQPRAWWVYTGVRAGGWKSCQPREEVQLRIWEAP